MSLPIAQLIRTLVQNVGAGATGAQVHIITPGNYAWVVDGTLGGSTVILEALGPDGVTWSQVTSSTSVTRVPVLIESGTIVRARVSGGTSVNLTSRLEFIA